MPVIIDTDVDTDDQMAIAYLLAQPSIEVKAITVACDGWSQQWAGVTNIMRLTQYFGQVDIPVAYSPRYNSDTQLNLDEPNGLPDPALQTGIGNFLSEHIGLPFNPRPPSWMYTDRLFFETLLNSKEKVNRIYFSGGIVVARDSTPTDKVWPYSAGTSSDATSFTGKPRGTEWNIFSDPIAANSVFSFGVPLVLATSTYTEGMHFYLNDTSFIPASCNRSRADLLEKIVTSLPTANGEDEEDLRYWDESAAVLAVQMMHSGLRAAVCREWDKKRFAVMMQAGNNASVSGGRYARLLENKYGKEAVECLAGNLTEFKLAFFSGLCGMSLHEKGKEMPSGRLVVSYKEGAPMSYERGPDGCFQLNSVQGLEGLRFAANLTEEALGRPFDASHFAQKLLDLNLAKAKLVPDHTPGIRERVMSTNLNLFGNYKAGWAESSWEIFRRPTSLGSFGLGGAVPFLKDIYRATGLAKELQDIMEKQMNLMSCIVESRSRPDR
ncbi:unnamed protein product [Effrenium voratum]|nr:unnamed protein product [Effrenium voratum]